MIPGYLTELLMEQAQVMVPLPKTNMGKVRLTLANL